MSLHTIHVFTNKTRSSLSPSALFHYYYYYFIVTIYLFIRFAREAIECQFCLLFGFLFGFQFLTARCHYADGSAHQIRVENNVGAGLFTRFTLLLIKEYKE